MSGARPWGLWFASGVAIVFGVATVLSGGQVLFGGDAARAAAGAYVPFVVWFNFIAGFAYIVAGVGLTLRHAWAVWLAIAIVAMTVLAAAAFAAHVVGGGSFEGRTVAALALRIAIWVVIAIAACRALGCPPRAR